MVEHDLAKVGVAGSSPVLCSNLHAGVAQLVEPLLPKQEVAGSSPVSRSRFVNEICFVNTRPSSSAAERILGKDEVVSSILILGF